MREHTYPMKHLEDAVIYRRAVLKAFKEAAESAEKEPLVKSDPRLTFVVIGAGLTGTELAAEMVDFCSDICDRYPAMRPYYRVVLIHNSGYLLPQLGKINGEYVKQELKSKNVAVLTNSPVTKIEPGRAYLANGRYVRARLICWAGGIAGSPVIRQSNITTTEDGRIPVDPYLRSKQYPDIYALGDNAYVIDPKINKAVPQLGQFAWKQGEYLGQCFYNDLFGISNEPYEPFSMGISISLGRREALTLSGPLRLTGITGRIAKDVSYSNYEFAIRPKSQLLGLR
jgi:NADH dehydrogenase